MKTRIESTIERIIDELNKFAASKKFDERTIEEIADVIYTFREECEQFFDDDEVKMILENSEIYTEKEFWQIISKDDVGMKKFQSLAKLNEDERFEIYDAIDNVLNQRFDLLDTRFLEDGRVLLIYL